AGPIRRQPSPSGGKRRARSAASRRTRGGSARARGASTRGSGGRSREGGGNTGARCVGACERRSREGGAGARVFAPEVNSGLGARGSGLGTRNPGLGLGTRK